MINSYYSHIHDSEGFYDYPSFEEMCKYSRNHIESIAKEPVSLTQISKQIIRLHIGKREVHFPIQTIKILNYMCRFSEYECHIDDIIINALSTAHDLIDVSKKNIKDKIEVWNKFCGTKKELQITLEGDFLWIGCTPEILLFEGEDYNIIERQRDIIIRNTQTFKEVIFTGIDTEIFLKLLSKKGKITEYRQVFKFMPSKWLQKDVLQCMNSIKQRISSLGCNICLEEKDWIGYTLYSQPKTKLMLTRNTDTGLEYKPLHETQAPQQVTSILDKLSLEKKHNTEKNIVPFYPRSISNSDRETLERMENKGSDIASLMARLEGEVVTISGDIQKKKTESIPPISNGRKVIDIIKNYDDPSIEKIVEFGVTFIEKYVPNKTVSLKIIKTQEKDTFTLHITKRNKAESFELREEELRIFCFLSRFEGQEFSKAEIKKIGGGNCIEVPAIASRVRRWNERVEGNSFLRPLVIHVGNKKNCYYLGNKKEISK